MCAHIRVSVCVCLCMHVCVCVSGAVCRREGGEGGAEVTRVVVQMSHSQWSLMNGSCCDGDGEMRRRPGLRTPVI